MIRPMTHRSQFGILLLFLPLFFSGCFIVEDSGDALPLRSCSYDTDCYWDEFCSDFGWCKLIDGCASNIDCPPGTYCEVDGNCLFELVCNFDYDCELGTYCGADGYCHTSVGCFTDYDCPGGYACNAIDGSCYQLIGCQYHSDCYEGYSCGDSGFADVCVHLGSCSVHSDCKTGEYCAGGGYCYYDESCTMDAQCAGGTYCDHLLTQKCIEPVNCQVTAVDSCPDIIFDESKFCVDHIDCGAGPDNFCTLDGMCVVRNYCDGATCRQGPCNSDLDCLPGLLCSNDTGQCHYSCNADLDCPAGYLCDFQTGRCF
ncbi:MAG TPA: hypothetical protein EYN06_10385 [Myxococcales bacterium]|nr:hypothetical protein [Myxococcales bacterium]